MNYTSLQIKDIEDCIKEAQSFRKNNNLKDTDYYRLAKTLYSRVESMGFDIALPFSWLQVWDGEIMPSKDGVSKPCDNDMIDKNMYKKDLVAELNISSATMAKMGKGETVSLEVLQKICEYLDCNIGDIMSFEKDEKTGKQ